MVWIALGVAGLALAGVTGWYVAATNVETPEYRVERSDGPIEIRVYPALLAAEVARDGTRQAAVRAGFSPLARYIFARDRGGETIAMTAPVTQTPAAAAPEKIAMTAPVTQTREDGQWRVRFLMPAGRTLADLPVPAGDVRLVEVPAQRVAAIRFSGGWSDAGFARAEATLAAWLDAQGLTAAGPPTYAYYNDPFTPSFLRRNEVLVPLGD